MQEALSGNYVNFGVFELYNDKALENALDVALSLALSVVNATVKVHKQRTDSFFEILRPTLGVSIGGDRGLEIQLEMQLVMVQTDCNDMSI